MQQLLQNPTPYVLNINVVSRAPFTALSGLGVRNYSIAD